MDITIVDENGVEINQLSTVEASTVSPLTAAFFKVAYERDPEFKTIIDDLANSVAQIVNELEVDE
jgi:hypothetical protein